MPRKGKISGRTLYTAEELLKTKYKLDGKLKRELEHIDDTFKKQQCDEKPKKVISLKSVVTQLRKSFKNVHVEEGTGYLYLKQKKKLICWMAQRKYGVSISFNTEEKKRVTKRITKKSDIIEIIDILKTEGGMNY